MNLFKLLLLLPLVAITIIGCGDDDDDNPPPPIVNKAPIANAGADKNITVNNPITITGSGTDSDGTVTSYEWREGTTILSNSASFSYTPSTVGEKILTLTVKDNDGATATDSVKIVSLSDSSISGIIYSYTTGDVLKDVNISTSNGEVLSNSLGEYNLSNMPIGDRVVVLIKKDGYSPTGKIISIENNRTIINFDISLLPVGVSKDFNASMDTTIEDNKSSASVNITANSLVLSDGSVATGTIHANLTAINPSLDIDLMPGDMSVEKDGQLASIESYGAINVEFKDENNNRLNLAPSTTATIRIPISTKGSTVPNTIPLYFFNEDTGLWIQEGTATRNGDYYEGTVEHFSTWNADYLFENITIHGCVKDTDNNSISNAFIRLEGINYNGRTSSYSNEDGNFDISAKKDAVSVFIASKDIKTSNSIKVGENEDTSSDITISECLLLNTIDDNNTLTVRLTWGEHPRDLDTHIIGPNNYHIYYSNLGELTSPLYFASLDVDDTSSYGPEVFTALNFPSIGRYHYAVNHYAGSETISSSPTRVELTLNGQTRVFIAPNVSDSVKQEWWNVFDIIVDENKNITIETVNTFSSDEPTNKLEALQKRFVLPPKNYSTK